MNFVEPVVTPIPSGCNSDPLSMMKVIEWAYRICYRSEKNMKDGSEELIGRILHNSEKGKMIHSSPLEHRRIQLACSSWIADMIECWQKKHRTAFIGVTNQKNILEPITSSHTHVIEGNFRAFFDFVQECERTAVVAQLTGETCERVMIRRAQIAVNNELSKYFPIIFKQTKLAGNEYSATDCNDVKYIGESKDYMSFHVVTTRDVLQEIARNRTISPNVESTRYCNYSKKGMSFCIPRPYEWANDIDWSMDFNEYIENETRPYQVVDSRDDEFVIVDPTAHLSTSAEQHFTQHSETRTYQEVSAKTFIEKASSMKDLFLFMTATSEAAYNKASVR